MRHLLTVADLTTEEIQRIFSISDDLKAKYRAGVREPLLPGRVMALVFEKPSLRTRVSFQSCMTHLGGSSIVLGDEAGFGKRETLADFTRVLSGMVDVIVLRAKSHASVEGMAACSSCAVVNGLTDRAHPCQALADLFTLRELHGQLAGLKLAWVGDANNVARSLAVGCALLGVRFAIASPPGYDFDEAFLAKLARLAPGDASSRDRQGVGGGVEATRDPAEAVRGAAAVYTDVWASMGQEAEQEQRRRDFAPYQVNAALMKHAGSDARFMHCLPAKRGEEVTDEVMDSPQSVIVEQAANRLHAQKGMLVWLLGAHA